MTKVALTIAGSDSGGGAGIQADLKTFHQYGVFGTSALVAITAQNTIGVHGVHAIPVDMVRAQIDAVADDLPPDAVKTGMLATVELVMAVAESINHHGFPNYVLDPVMVATSGDPLLDKEAERTVRDHLVPIATLVTPNLDEASILVEDDVTSVERMSAAGKALVGMGARAALVKGGHLDEEQIVDVLVTAESTIEIAHRKIDTTSTHGTGCTLSAAIAARLALGSSLEGAVRDGLDFVQRAIANAPGLGRGHGPLNHFVPRETAG
jgi:hydroxymethylpyrimidine/phosphomethylpyrimidine kinase